jgi:hypothetical protein
MRLSVTAGRDRIEVIAREGNLVPGLPDGMAFGLIARDWLLRPNMLRLDNLGRVVFSMSFQTTGGPTIYPNYDSA